MSLRTSTLLVLLFVGLAPMLALTGLTLSSAERGLQRYVEAESFARLNQAAAGLRSRLDRLQITAQIVAQELGEDRWRKTVRAPSDGQVRAELGDVVDSLVSRWSPGKVGDLTISVRDESGQEMLLLEPVSTGGTLESVEVSNKPLSPHYSPGDMTRNHVRIEGTTAPRLRIASAVFGPERKHVGEVVMSTSALTLFANVFDHAIALPNGTYLNKPADMSAALGDSAFADFPELLGTTKSTIHSARSDLPTAWISLSLDAGDGSLIWIGTATDTAAAIGWGEWYIRTAGAIAAVVLFPAVFIGWLVARRTRVFHREMLDRLDRVMIRDERVGFHWGSSREVREFTTSLTALGERFFEAESARKLEERRLREELEQAEENLAAVSAREAESRRRLAGLPVAVMHLDTGGSIQFCNDAAAETLDYGDPARLVGQSFHDTLQPKYPDGSTRGTEDSAIMTALKSGRGAYVAEDVMARAQGSQTPVEMYIEPANEDSTDGGLLVAFHDITLRQRAEAIAHREREQLQRTLEAITDGVVTADTQGRVQFMNVTAEKMLGWRLQDAKGLLISEVYLIVGETPEESDASISPDVVAKEGMLSESGEPIRRRNGEMIYVQRDALPVRDSEGTNLGMVLVLRDVTEDRQREKALRYQATHDPLTQLVNRYEFEQRLDRVLTAQEEYPGEYPLCFLDLDRFKVVNDTCGHAAGDELLRQLAKTLRSVVRQRDTFARLGGDEFAILLSHCPLHRALVLMERLLAEVRDFQFVWEDKSFEVGVSIGIVMLTPDLHDAATAIGVADRACYRAKQHGGNHVQVHKPNDLDEQRRQEDAQWAVRISKALKENRFKLYYQPIVATERAPRNGDSAQIEVFVRMVDEQGEMIAPDVFLPPAERHKLSRGLDRWVLGKVFEWSAKAADEGAKLPDLIHINVSSQTLTDGAIVDYLRQLTTQSGVPAESICLDIKEAHAVLDSEAANDFIRYVRKLGFRVALGGCGKAHASPSFLKGLLVDYFKIHGELIRHVADNQVDLEIARSISHVAHALGRKVIAEWVENDAVLRAVRRIEVDFAQGNGIARPKPLDFYGGST